MPDSDISEAGEGGPSKALLPCPEVPCGVSKPVGEACTLSGIRREGVEFCSMVILIAGMSSLVLSMVSLRCGLQIRG